MAKYEVITIAIAVKNNRIAKFGETVDDSELTVNGNALVEAGSLKLIQADTVQVEEVSVLEQAPLAEESVVEETTVEELKVVEEVVLEEVKKAPTAAEKASSKK